VPGSATTSPPRSEVTTTSSAVAASAHTLQFRLVDQAVPLSSLATSTSTGVSGTAVSDEPSPSPSSEGCLDPTAPCVTTDKEGRFLLRLEPASLTGSSVREAQAIFHDQWLVTLRFDANGTRQFATLTAANVGRQVAIVVDGIVQSFPTIDAVTEDGQAEISGSFTLAEARQLTDAISAAAR
jgi:preprotein translocase subunit SecD